MRKTLTALTGWVSVGAGVIGIVVPLWPSTCFFLFAAWCFSRSSERANRWLHGNRWFGRELSQYRTDGMVPFRVKVGSQCLLWSSISITVVLLDNLAIQVVLLMLAATISVHILRLPTTGPVRGTTGLPLRT